MATSPDQLNLSLGDEMKHWRQWCSCGCGAIPSRCFDAKEVQGASIRAIGPGAL